MLNRLTVTALVAALFLACGPAVAQSGGSGGSSGGSKSSQKSKQKSPSSQKITQEQADGTGATVYLGTASVRKIQQKLNQQGYNVGEIDGHWGASSQTATRNYQRSNGLEPTGTVTVALLNKLGMSSELSGGKGGQSGQKSGQKSGGKSGGQSKQSGGSEQSKKGGQGKQGGQSQQAQASQEKPRKQERAEGPGTPLYIGPAAVRQIQRALNKKGYDVGKLDGKWGSTTQRATRNFQQAQGLEPTGDLDVGLISALMLQKKILPAGKSGGGKSGGSGGSGGSSGSSGGGSGGSGGSSGSGGSGGSSSGGGSQGSQPQKSDQWSQEASAGQGTPLHVGPAMLRQVVRKLNMEGYDAGSVDGQWSEGLRAAIRDYQKDQGMEPTGTLTPASLAKLGTPLMKGQGGKQQSGKKGSGGEKSKSKKGSGGEKSKSKKKDDSYF